MIIINVRLAHLYFPIYLGVLKKDKLADLYSGIEVIKNGVCYDKRYHAKKLWFS